MLNFCDEDGFGPLISDKSAISPCFSEAVIEPIFYAIFLVVAQNKQMSLSKLPVVLLPNTFPPRFKLKLALCFIQVVYPAFLTLIIVTAHMQSSYSFARFLSYLLRTVVWMVCTRLLLTEYSKAIIQSKEIRVFWFLQFVVDSVACLVPHAGDKELLTIFSVVNFVLSLCLAILSLFPDDIDLFMLLEEDYNPYKTQVDSDDYYSLGGEESAFFRSYGRNQAKQKTSTIPTDPFTFTRNTILGTAVGDTDSNEFGYFTTDRQDNDARFTPSTKEAKLWAKYLNQSTIEEKPSFVHIIGLPEIEAEVNGCSINPNVTFTLDVRIKAEFDLSENIFDKNSDTNVTQRRRWIVSRSLEEFLDFDTSIQRLLPISGVNVDEIPQPLSIGLVNDPTQINKTRSILNAYFQRVVQLGGLLYKETLPFIRPDESSSNSDSFLADLEMYNLLRQNLFKDNF